MSVQRIDHGNHMLILLGDVTEDGRNFDFLWKWQSPIVQENFFQKQHFHEADTPIFGHLSGLFPKKVSNTVL